MNSMTKVFFLLLHRLDTSHNERDTSIIFHFLLLKIVVVVVVIIIGKFRRGGGVLPACGTFYNSGIRNIFQ